MGKEIAITGIGAVTGYGWGKEALWNGLASGKTAANLVGGFGQDDNQPGWVAQVPEGGNPKDGTPFARAMRAAAREAIADAGNRGWQPGRTVGLLHATVLGDVATSRAFHKDPEGWPIRKYLSTMPSTPVSLLMKEYGFHGPAMNVSAMCASGNAGMLTAKMWIDAGMATDVVLVVTDLSLKTPEELRNFVKLGVGVSDAEPTDACRPFQEGSRGFAMGEASVAFVVSAKEGLSPYAQMRGGAMSHDGHHVTSINPDLVQVERCFADALANANVSAEDVRYLNAHGPGTAQCDRAEAAMLERFFLPSTGVYSIKQLVGHCQGAAAAVEIAVAALGYERGYLPLPAAVAPAHRQLLTGATPIDGGITVKSSLGMGGHNSVIVLAPPA